MACFDPVADRYDAFCPTPLGALVDAGERQMVGELLDPHPGEPLMELGCGTETYVLGMADVRCVVVGVDESEAMLAKARSKDVIRVRRMGPRRSNLLTLGVSFLRCRVDARNPGICGPSGGGIESSDAHHQTRRPLGLGLDSRRGTVGPPLSHARPSRSDIGVSWSSFLDSFGVDHTDGQKTFKGPWRPLYRSRGMHGRAGVGVGIPLSCRPFLGRCRVSGGTV